MNNLHIILFIIILFIICLNPFINKNSLPNTYYTRQAKRKTILLPPPDDYKNLFGKTINLLNEGYDVKNAITISFNKNRDAVYRKIERVNTAILRYLDIDEKDKYLNLEILSALVLLSKNERYILLNMCENPEKYIKNEDKEQEIDNFINFYSSYLNIRNGVEDRLKIYATKKTWLNAIPENIPYKNNNVARYFWMNMKVMLFTPAIFCKAIIHNDFNDSVNKFKNLITESFDTNKNLIEIDFYNEYLD